MMYIKKCATWRLNSYTCKSKQATMHIYFLGKGGIEQASLPAPSLNHREHIGSITSLLEAFGTGEEMLPQEFYRSIFDLALKSIAHFHSARLNSIAKAIIIKYTYIYIIT